MVIGADFAHKLSINQYRKGFKPFPNQHRRTKVRKTRINTSNEPAKSDGITNGRII